jgi:hypothetical protein
MEGGEEREGGGRQGKRGGVKTAQVYGTYYLARRSKTFLVSSSARGRIVCVGSRWRARCVGGSDGDGRAGGAGLGGWNGEVKL